MVTEPCPATTFADRLLAAVRERGNPVCVGLDPRWQQLPPALRGEPAASFVDRASVYSRFCREVIDVVAPLVPAVKPQVAFFEQLGVAGMKALSEVIAHASRAGLVVIADAKRGDIGSTAEAYADAWLGRGQTSAWGADALTVNPYLGSDSLQPLVDTAVARQAGLFVLVKTSNPGGGEFQDPVSEGRTIYQRVASLVERLADEHRQGESYGPVGAVVGATYPAQLAEARAAMPHAWLLVPGFGHQGGAAADVAGAFDPRGTGALVNNARGIIFAHARKEYSERFAASQWQRAVEAATREMIGQLRGETLAGRLGGSEAAR